MAHNHAPIEPDASAQRRLTQDRPTEETAKIYRSSDVVEHTESEIWCRLRDSNPRPTDYKSELGLYHAFSYDLIIH